MAKVGDGRELQGTVAFSAVGRPHYGFDVFTIDLPESFRSADADSKTLNEKRLTDGKSVNFNAQFVDGSDALVLLQGNAFIRSPNTCVDFINGEGMAMAVVHVSERNGAARIYFSYEDEDARKVVLGPLLNATALNHNNNSDDEPFFFDRPIVKNGKVYFVSSQDPADKALKSWSAVYSTCLRTGHTVRLTPPGVVDYSPSISPSGKWIAVASYGGTREWEGQVQDLETDLYVLNAEDGSNRTLLVHGGGWPTWADDRTLYFHKRAPDGWWSVYRLKLTMPIPPLPSDDDVQRITPPSIHAFTPCASPTREWIAVATRRPDSKFRHIEIFHLPSNSFIALTNSLNPEIHHYNPFVSANSTKIGFHRFRGPVAREDDDAVVPYLESVRSPLPRLKMLRINGFFPAFSPDGLLIAYNPYLTIAYNPDLTQNEGGVCIVKADASKMWKIFQGPAFAVAWNGKQKGVVYATLGPIFAADRATVHIISITFDPQELGDDEEKGVKTEVRFLTKDGTNNNAFPFSSPEGKQLVFRSGRSGHKNLYIMDAERGEEGGIVRLTEGEWIDTMPCWSPDGQWIAFSSNRHNPQNSDGVFGIYLIHPDGTGLHRVLMCSEKERVNHVCFGPDSKSLLFTGNLSGLCAEPVSVPNQFQPYGELYVSALDGSDLQRLTFNAYEDGTPAWHPSSLPPPPPRHHNKIAGQKLTGLFDEPLWLNANP